MFTEIEKLDFEPWVPILDGVAEPARYPRFHELTANGDWNNWSSSVQFSDEEPKTVKQPQWTQVLRPIGDTDSYELELYPGGLHHKPLESGYIRLLDIQNVRFVGNVLQGFRLVTVPLANAPSFDALSYCWGDMRLCTGILFDTGTGPDLVERMLRVTEDLATCLFSILMTRSLVDKPKYLWIDQICINQKNIEERNEQVGKMADIYRTARQVLVWLGQKSDFAIENMELPESPAADIDINGQSLISWVIDMSVFARPWFFRIWVIQEVVLASHIQVLVGEDCQPWESLVKKAQTMDHPSAATRTVVEMNKLTRKLNWSIVGTIGYCRNRMAQAGLVELQTWLPLIVTTQQCRNPRDKIYGLIGLDYATPEWKGTQNPHPAQRNGSGYIERNVSQDSLHAEGSSTTKRRPDVSFRMSRLPADFIDYGKPVTTVFRDFARLMVESRRSLKLLTLYDHDTTAWFPQFLSTSGDTSPGLMQGLRNRDQFAASAQRIHVPAPPKDDGSLDVKGRAVAEVAIDVAEMPSNFKDFYYNPADSLNLADLCRRCWMHVEPTYGKSAEDNYTAAFTKDMVETIFCHESDFDDTAVAQLEGRSTAQVYSIIYNLLGLGEVHRSHSEMGAEITDHDIQAVRVALSRKALHVLGRRLVIMDTGHLALVQKGVREGDKVAILHGLDVPCVMRKGEDGISWQWLGDAFVLGLMRGEGVRWEEDDADTFTLV